MLISDDKILKVATFVSIIGLIGMIVFSSFISPNEVKINEIDNTKNGEDVLIKGVVEEVSKFPSGDTYYLMVNDGSSKIKVIVFESIYLEMEKEGIDLNDFLNKKVSIFGTVTEYKKSTEIILKDVKSLKILR